QTRAGLSRADVRRWGGEFRTTTREYQPRIASMLDGVAEGSGVDPAEISALNGRTELLYGEGRTAGDGECTAIGLIGDGTLLGQNWDWHPDQRPYSLLLGATAERAQ